MQREKSIQKLKNSIIIALFAVIILVCSQIAIPFVIPFTLQSLGVFLAFGILGGKKGLISFLLYLALGLVGVPISASGEVGIGVFVGPTAGYFIGWIICGVIFWVFESRTGNTNKIRILFLSIGTICCYITGSVWFAFVYSYNNASIGIWSALCYCVFPFIAFDAIKLFVANVITDKIRKKVKI